MTLLTLSLAAAVLAGLVLYAGPGGRATRLALMALGLTGAASLGLRGFVWPAIATALGGAAGAWLLTGDRERAATTFTHLVVRLGVAFAAVVLSLWVVAFVLGGNPSLAVAGGVLVLSLGLAGCVAPQDAGGSTRAGALLLSGVLLVAGHAGALALPLPAAVAGVTLPLWVATSATRPSPPRRSWRFTRSAGAWLVGAALAEAAAAVALPSAVQVAGITLHYPSPARGLLVLQAAGLVAITLFGAFDFPVPRPQAILAISLGALALSGLSDPAPWLAVWVGVLALLPFTSTAEGAASRRALLLLGAAVVGGELLATNGVPGLALGTQAKAAGVAIGAGMALLLGAFPRGGPLARGRASAAWWLIVQPALLATLLQIIPLAGRAGASALLQALLASLGAFTALLAAGEAVIETRLDRLAECAGRFAMGLMLVGIASLRPGGIAGALLLGIDVLLARGLFTALGQIARRATESEALDRLPDAVAGQPRLRGAWLVGLAAVAGIPPFVGFSARLLIFRAAFDQSWPIALLAVAASAMWLYAVLRLAVLAAVLPPRVRAQRFAAGPFVLAWAPAAIALATGMQPARLTRWLFGLPI